MKTAISSDDSLPPQPPVLVTGATGYVGGRLVPRLLDRGYQVRCIVRSPEKIEHRPWRNHDNLEVIQADVRDQEAVISAMRECRCAYYLVHSMIAAGGKYAEKDLELARAFREASEQAGLERIIYLGGLGELGEGLSKHLRSRREVEYELSDGPVPVTILRAAMIIGSGSASFEILRYLVEHLPIMITPKWVRTETQPIAIRNVLDYLVGCLEQPATTGRTFDIGGPDVLSYQAVMDVMAQQRGLSRLVIPVPVLTPRLSSLWIDFVTPVNKEIARPLAEGLRNRTVCRNNAIRQLLPQKLLSVEEAIAACLVKLGDRDIETSWSMAGQMPGDPNWSGGTLYCDHREVEVNAPPAKLFQTICRIGGEHGYYRGDWLWHLRGWMDKFVGGPGLRRGRRHPQDVVYGEAIDFWRVTGVETDRLLKLRAEMKLPGIAELAFRVEPIQEGTSRLLLDARFQPKGVTGIAYWYLVKPLHEFVFPSLVKGLKSEAERLQ